MSDANLGLILGVDSRFLLLRTYHAAIRQAMGFADTTHAVLILLQEHLARTVEEVLRHRHLELLSVSIAAMSMS